MNQTPAPSWWVSLPPDQFYREAAKRAIELRQQDNPKGINYSLDGHPWRKKPDGHRVRVQEEAA